MKKYSKQYSSKDADIKRDIGTRLRQYCKAEYDMTLEEIGKQFAKSLGIEEIPGTSTVGGWGDSPPLSFIFWIKEKAKLRWEWIMEGKGSPRKL